MELGGVVVLDSQSYVIVGPNGFNKSGTIDLDGALGNHRPRPHEPPTALFRGC